MPTTASTARRSRETAPAPTPSRAVLEANLRAIAAKRPDLAERLAQTPADPNIAFSIAEDGALTAAREGRALASRRRPLEEARRIADPLDVREHAVYVALGFALGHHARAIAGKLGKTGILCVFEPDLSLLRAVLERVDHSPWMNASNVVFFDDPEDAAAVSAAATGVEAIFGLGVRFVEHGPSAARLAESGTVFSKTVARAVAALRTSIVTTMVQTEITIRNSLMNAEHYVARAGAGDEGVVDLENRCAGRPAIVIAAGPSLRRNIHLLKNPAVRDRCVLIAVQTTLKTLLAEGVRPHFVAALDYHEISTRFYEGLTAEDVRGVTLIAEPKVSPAVLDAWPGALRTTADEHLDLLLPPELAGDHGRIRPGATVAHLCHHIARHLGCDPVILTGQDLAFTGGLYYGEGAAIHDVWAPELGPFRTLETFEWERIARHRRMLRAATDRFGETLFTDEQMATYLAQFEKLFAEDQRAGRTTIDATEGGAAKKHTRPMTLERALDEFASGDPLPEIPTPPRAKITHERPAKLLERLGDLRRQTGRLAALCEQSRATLRKMQDAGGDQKKINRLIDRIDELRSESERLGPAYDLVQRINQTGAFNRAKADREINLSDLDGPERQRRQIERDITNVRWLEDAAAEVARLLDAAGDALTGAPKLTSTSDAPRAGRTPSGPIPAVIFADPEFDSLGRPRSLTARALRGTLERLAASDAVDRVIIAATDEAAVRPLLEGAPLPAEIVPIDRETLRSRRQAVAAARAWNPEAWRGAIAGLTVYDELFEPALLAELMNRLDLEAVALVGDDWTELDPALVDATVRRRQEDPEQRRVAFTQAAPGLAPVVVSRALIEEFAGASDAATPWSTLGGMLGYMPFNPLADPIAKPLCAPVDRRARDASRVPAMSAPVHVIFELTPERLGRFGLRADWLEPSGAAPLEPAAQLQLVRRAVGAFPGAAVSFAGAGDPLTAPHWRDAITVAREAGAAHVHVRTEPIHDETALLDLARLADVVSLDLYADSPDAYERITGEDEYHAAIEGTELTLDARRPAGRALLPWVVPRITRCEAASRDIPGFYDRWLGRAGAAVIDPLPRRVEGERFEPMTPPRLARERLARTTLCVRCNGAVVAGTDLSVSGDPVASLTESAPADAWRRTLESRGVRDRS